jgi:hypothetical protein
MEIMELKLRKIEELESESDAQMVKAQELINDGAIDLSSLSLRDRVLFASIELHSTTSKINQKFSIGWPASKIKTALPEFFDDNLAQDLSEFADSQVHLTYNGVDHSTIYQDNSDSKIILQGNSTHDDKEKVLKAFPILNEIVSFTSILQLLKTVYNNVPRATYSAPISLPSHSFWPVPKHFTWEEKKKRCESRWSDLIMGVTSLGYSAVEAEGLSLTEIGAKEIIEKLEITGIDGFEKFIEDQREISKIYLKNSRSKALACIRDNRGFLSKSRMDDVLKGEKEVLKIEKKHGVKRKLELPEGEKKGTCAICKRQITASLWKKHIDSRVHMEKALKLK